MPISFVVRGPIAISAAYSGPGDVVAGALGWWGLRAYSAASIGGNVVRIARDDEASAPASGSNFGCLANGNLDDAAIATYLAGHAGGIMTFFDQTGHGNDIVSAAFNSGGGFSTLAVYTPNSLNSHSTSVSVGSSGNYESPSITQAQPFSMSTVVKATYVAARAAIFSSYSGSSVEIGQENVVDLWYITDDGFSNVPTFSVTSGHWHAVQVAHISGAPIVNVDNSENTLSTAGTGGISSTTRLFARQGGGADFSGSFAEFGIWSGTINATNRTNLYNNQIGYWGTLP